MKCTVKTSRSNYPIASLVLITIFSLIYYYGKLSEIQMNNLFSLDNTTNKNNQTQLNTLIITKYGCYVLF